MHTFPQISIVIVLRDLPVLPIVSGIEAPMGVMLLDALRSQCGIVCIVIDECVKV